MTGRPGPRAVYGATRHLWVMLGILAVGWAAGAVGPTGGLSDSSGYLFLTSLLLAVGLYGSTSGIDVRAARADLRILVLAVTVGVLAKAALIGLVLWFTIGNHGYVVLAVAVAQIDPLSVAALRDRSPMSARGKSVLAVWAAFDDPVTVLLTAYTAPIALRSLDGGATGRGITAHGPSAYASLFGWNLLLALGAAAVWLLLRRAARRGARRTGRTAAALMSGAGVQSAALAALAGLVVLASARSLMLGVALTGLFFRPEALIRRIDAISRGALLLATFTLGLLLTDGIDLVHGVILGAAAYASQIVVGPVVARRLDRVDRVCLALGQQNGVTAIILALSLEPSFPRAVAIVAPAIVTVNVLHAAANAGSQPGLRRAAGGGQGAQPAELPDGGGESPSMNSGSRTPASRAKPST